MNNPIVIIGCGGSGTTLLYNMLCCHPELGWFSNYTDRFPRARLVASLSLVYPFARRHGWRSRFLSLPSEGYPFWDRLCDLDGLPREDPLDDADVTAVAREEASDAVASLLRFQRKPRFINKNTRNTRRLRYVDALLDQPVIINVIRDPRATVSSLLRVAFWPSISVWSQGNVRPPDWLSQGKDPAELAAHLWASDVGKSLDDKNYLPQERYVEVRYESLVGDRAATLSGILSRTGIEMTSQVEMALESFQMLDANDKFARHLTPSQLDLVAEVTGPLARSLGYELD